MMDEDDLSLLSGPLPPVPPLPAQQQAKRHRVVDEEDDLQDNDINELLGLSTEARAPSRFSTGTVVASSPFITGWEEGEEGR